MNLTLELEKPPLQEDGTGAIRVGDSRVLLELVVRAFQDGASPEAIVQNYSTLSLSDVYLTLGYFLRHQEAVEAYLQKRESIAEEVHQRISESQHNMQLIRTRLLAQKPSAKDNAKSFE